MPPVKKHKPHRSRTYLRAWRQYRHLTQEQAAGRIGCDRTTLSRIESGKVPYNQDFLEAAALAYNCEVWELLMSDPHKEGAIVDVAHMLRRADPEDRAKIIGFAQGILEAKKAG
ncbi:MAG: XRE family transcriptional regulator [Alphaproteobacteria bacterium]|nr:MAG: XRE family transcriptional regulator [Alphaproteobacteria bacterium]